MPITWKGKGLKEVGVDPNGKVIVRINKKYYRPTEVDYLLGDSKLAKKHILSVLGETKNSGKKKTKR